MAATEICRRALRRAQQALLTLGQRAHGARRLSFLATGHLLGALGGLLASGHAQATELPEDRADLMLHSFNGGGVDAWGPALFVRKNLLNKVSLFATYYADIVSNASIDVITTASPYHETRHEYGIGFDYAVRDSMITLAGSYSTEPDYTATAFNIDVTQDVFGGMTSVALGYTYGSDDVGKVGEGFFSNAKHWRYRVGLTQILTPRWYANMNFEVVSDDGYLGSPYRMALVFGAAVPERLPPTRTSRTLQFRTVGEVVSNVSVRAEYRYFWDTWDITAHTIGVGGSAKFGEKWLVDAYARSYRQDGALFYSDNATTETQYVTRNRQLSNYTSWTIGTKATYALTRVPGRYDLFLNGAIEYWKTDYKDFTNLQTGNLYSYNATVLQLFVTAFF